MSSGVPDEPHSQDRERRARRGRRILPALAVVALPVVLTLLHMQTYRSLSPFDEGAHVDYLLKVLDWNNLVPGDHLEQEAMRQAACRGIEVEGIGLPPCRAEGTYDPSEFPAGGYNYLHHHPPLYYLVTGLVVRPLMLAGLDVVDAGRLTDGLWAGLGLLVVWFVMRRLDLPVGAALISLAVLAVTPAVVHISATVNNDATTMLAGAALLLVAIRWESRAGGLLAVAGVASIAVLLKGTNLVAVAAVGVYLSIRGIRALRDRNGRGPMEYLAAAGALGAASLIAQIGWIALRPEGPARFSDPALENLRADSVSVIDVLARSADLILPTGSATVPGFSGEAAIPVLVQVISLVIVAATLGAGLFLSSSDRAATVGMAGFLSLPVGAVLLTLGNFLFLGIYLSSLPDRYGLGAVPLLAVGLARGLRAPVARWAVAILGAALGGAVLWAIFTHR